ncbi:hypothetical protein AHAS_Ahas10G0181700 [Arachis hypogaea]
MPEGMSKLTSLQVLSKYVVGKREGNKINELGTLANLHQTIFIDRLENVVNSSEALEARMFEKDGIECLLLEWSPDESENTVDSQIERDILEKLQPHSNLKQLQIWGYRGTTFPDWDNHGHNPRDSRAHDTLIDIERNPNELHQVFLDMAVLFQSQGKELNDIENHVARANSYVCGGSSSCSLQGSTRRIPEVHLHWQFGIIILIIIILIIVLLSREIKSTYSVSVSHMT